MDGAPAERPAVAIAIPAYNEVEGIGEFLTEIDAALAGRTRGLTLVVADDASSDGTSDALQALAPSLQAALVVNRGSRNQGHGPTLMKAYRRALQENPDYVLAVDGDGQFQGSDLRRLLVLLQDQAHAVCGVRRFRQDPWFRMTMTRLLRAYLRVAFGVRARDGNCPLRGYESPLLADLLARLPEDCLIPNLYLTVLAERLGASLVEVDVTHRVRRGSSAKGSSWGGGIPSPIPWRLVRFSVRALLESREFRATLKRRLSRSPDAAAAPDSTATRRPRLGP